MGNLRSSSIPDLVSCLVQAPLATQNVRNQATVDGRGYAHFPSCGPSLRTDSVSVCENILIVAVGREVKEIGQLGNLGIRGRMKQYLKVSESLRQLQRLDHDPLLLFVVSDLRVSC